MTLPVPMARLAKVHEPSYLTPLHEALDSLAFLADSLAESGDIGALGDGLGRLREFRKAVTDLEQHIEDHVARLMDSDRVLLDGLVMERHHHKDRKGWQSEDLLRHLVGDRLIDPETGENVYADLVACLPLTASLSWRVKALRERGVDVGDWCNEAPGRPTVTVYRTEEETDG